MGFTHVLRSLHLFNYTVLSTRAEPEYSDLFVSLFVVIQIYIEYSMLFFFISAYLGTDGRRSHVVEISPHAPASVKVVVVSIVIVQTAAQLFKCNAVSLVRWVKGCPG